MEWCNIVVPVIYLSRLPLLIYSKQSNLSLFWAQTKFSDPVSFIASPSVLWQKPRNRTTFRWLITCIRLLNSRRNSLSSNVFVFTSIRFTATFPFRRTPCWQHLGREELYRKLGKLGAHNPTELNFGNIPSREYQEIRAGWSFLEARGGRSSPWV